MHYAACLNSGCARHIHTAGRSLERAGSQARATSGQVLVHTNDSGGQSQAHVTPAKHLISFHEPRGPTARINSDANARANYVSIAGVW